MNRRSLLRASLVAPAGLLASCTMPNGPAPAPNAGLVADAKLTANAVAALWAQIQATPGILTPALVAQLQPFEATAVLAANQISDAFTTASNATQVNVVIQTVGEFAQTLVGIVLPPPLPTILSALVSMIPVLEAYISANLNTVSARKAPMPPHIARAVLLAYHG